MIWGLEQRNTVKSAVQKEKYGPDLKQSPISDKAPVNMPPFPLASVPCDPTILHPLHSMEKQGGLKRRMFCRNTGQNSPGHR